MFELKPIGYVNSWYKVKNGTPRQSSVCPESKGFIKINKTFFDKPWNSLIDLNKFSHAWIIFHFHKNTNKKVRAKIKPPRLNGETTGLFATRSPHRPNPIGLSLVKLEKIENDTIYISGIDILDETPVLDIKPYIHDYDYPKVVKINFDDNDTKNKNYDEKNIIVEDIKKDEKIVFEKNEMNQNLKLKNNEISRKNEDFNSKNEEIKTNKEEIKNEQEIKNEEPNTNVVQFINNLRIDENPEWINQKGVIYETSNSLKKEKFFQIIFTERSLNQLKLFHSKTSNEHLLNFKIEDYKDVKNFYLNHKNLSIETKDEKLKNINENEKLKCKYCLQFLNTTKEVKNAIKNILQEDPRSTYRRLKCSDRLYYLTIDTIHITCWFDEEEKIIEIIKIKPNLI